MANSGTEQVTRMEIEASVKTIVDKSSLAKTKKTLETALGGNSIKALSVAWGGMKKAIGGVTNTAVAPIKKMGSAVKETTKHLSGFFGAIKRIAIYRAIRSALKSITQGFQEGIKNAYQWSVVTGNQFARSMDMMATSALYLKNSLGAMTMPLVNYLAPILDRLIDQFVELINVVNRFIATITGAGSWVKALKYPAQYMDSMAGSAKELKNQLLGFDDLNILNAPRGGGSASALDYSNMFQEVALEASQINFTKSIIDAIKSSDWERVAEVIDEYINDAIERIDAVTLARNLGEKLNKAIRLIHTLLKAVDFQMIGTKIGEFISNLQLDWGRIASSWIRWNTNVLDALLGLFRGVNWGQVGYSLGEYIKGLFNELKTWLNGIDWYTKGQEFTQALIDFIGRVDWSGVTQAIWSFLKACLKSALDALIGALGKIEFDRYGQLVVPNVTMPNPQGTTAYQAYQNALAQGNYQLAQLLARQNGFANGGFPEKGTYFYAGEDNNPEFVGQVGGRTAVYNSDQMTGALATANEGVVNTLTAVGNAIVSAINHKNMSINTNDVRRAINGMNMRYGV